MQDRNSIRKMMRAKRRELTPAQQRRAAHQLARRLRALPAFRHARNIALYLPNDGEIDPTILMEGARKSGHRCFLPCLTSGAGRTLRFVRYQPDDPLIRNCYGISEPDFRTQLTQPAWTLDLILMPLVAFDRAGNRLGMGGGYYDRTLSRSSSMQHMRRPALIGLAHAFQDAGRLDRQPWDVPLDWIATPSEIIATGRGVNQ